MTSGILNANNLSNGSGGIVRRPNIGLDIGPHQIVQSDEEDDDIPAYGFPSQKRRNRLQNSDMDLVFNREGS